LAAASSPRNQIKTVGLLVKVVKYCGTRQLNNHAPTIQVITHFLKLSSK